LSRDGRSPAARPGSKSIYVSNLSNFNI